MKKYFCLILAVIICFISIISIVCVYNFIEKKPFRDLTVDSFENTTKITVVYSKKDAYMLNEDNSIGIVKLLNNLTITSITKPDDKIYTGSPNPEIYIDLGEKVKKITFYETPDKLCISIDNKLYNTSYEAAKLLLDYCKSIVNDNITN